MTDLIGLKSLRDHEALLHCFISRLSDFKGVVDAEAVKVLENAHEQAPKSIDFAGASFSFMALELFLRDRSNGGSLIKDVNGFLKFATAQLYLPRKDQPAKASMLLDKLLKALWAMTIS